MVEGYKYEQHKRVAERQEQGPVTTHKVRQQHVAKTGSKIALFNNKVGLGITQSVGTMWAAYAFALIALVSLPAAISSGETLVIVAWVAQTFLQLVLLPVIIVGQNIQAQSADARAKATYDDAGAILEESKQIQMHLEAQDQAITHILDQLLALQAGEVKVAAAKNAKK